MAPYSVNDILPYVTAVAALVAAVASVLGLRKRYELPIVDTKIQLYQGGQRVVHFQLEGVDSEWLISAVRMAQSSRKFLSEGRPFPIPPYNHVKEWELVGGWKRQVLIDPPRRRGRVILHNDAAPRRFLYTVVLKSNPKIRRTVSSFC